MRGFTTAIPRVSFARKYVLILCSLQSARKLKQSEAAALLAGPVSFEVKCCTSYGCTAFAQHRAHMDLFPVVDELIHIPFAEAFQAEFEKTFY